MRTTTITVLLCAGILLAGCGSDEDETTLSAEGGDAAVVADGADSQIVDGGDPPPDGETEPASIVNVTVGVPPDTDLAGNAIITLEDVTLVDTESLEIARVEIPISELAAQDHQVEMFLPLPLDGSIEVNAAVHLDIDENGSFSPGDWISPDLAMVTSESAANIVVDVVPI